MKCSKWEEVTCGDVQQCKHDAYPETNPPLCLDHGGQCKTAGCNNPSSVNGIVVKFCKDCAMKAVDKANAERWLVLDANGKREFI